MSAFEQVKIASRIVSYAILLAVFIWHLLTCTQYHGDMAVASMEVLFV